MEHQMGLEMESQMLLSARHVGLCAAGGVGLAWGVPWVRVWRLRTRANVGSWMRL